MTNANGVNSSPAACCAWFRPADRSPDDRQVLSKDPPDTKALLGTSNFDRSSEPINCSHRIEQRTVFRQQRRGYASRVAMGCPHLFDSPISYPAPHENGVSGAAFPAFALQVRAVATQACWLKKPTRFSFLKSPQVSIAAIAALQPEPCARGGFIRLLMGRRDPHPRTTPMAPPGPASD
jgi:hypothetical protein